MRMLVSFATLALLGTVAYAQAPVPTGMAPQIGLATAVQQEGKIVIEICEMREVIRLKLEKGGDVFVEKRHWSVLATGTLGNDIRAYRPDGQLAGPQEVLKALAKPSGVVYFLGYDKAKPAQPDRFYLSLLKEGSVALALDRPELVPPVPPPVKP